MGENYEGRSIYKEPVAVVFLIFEILKIQDSRFVEIQFPTSLDNFVMMTSLM